MVVSYHRLTTDLRLLILVGVIPVAVLVAFVDEIQSVGGRLLLGAVLLGIPLPIAFLSGAVVRVREGRVWIGFVPFYVVRLQADDIVGVGTVDVSPFEEFGGWGIKGRATRTGLLLSAGGTRVVELEVADSRRYLVSAKDPDGVADALAQLLAPG